MLKLEQLKCHRRGRNIIADFVSPDDPELKAFAETLMLLGRRAAAEHLDRKQLSELLSDLDAEDSAAFPAAGLIRLFEEQLTFAAPSAAENHAEFRQKQLKMAAQLLKNPPATEAEYQRLLAESHTLDLYGDLPEFETVQHFNELTATELLNRYNLALVQRLLLDAQNLQLTVDNAEPAELRRLLKYLKFFRLLAEVGKTASGALKLDISGPVALFGANRKYALNLAAFFPAVVRLPEWKIRAEIKTAKSSAILKLDQSAHLVSHYRSFSAYVPEEIKLFHQYFGQKSETWEIIGDTPILNAGLRHYLIPDLSFRHRADGRICHLELFHMWHASALPTRLEWLSDHPETPVIIGIDRRVDDVKALTARYPNLSARIFAFRDFPGVETVLRHLNLALAVAEPIPHGHVKKSQHNNDGVS